MFDFGSEIQMLGEIQKMINRIILAVTCVITLTNCSYMKTLDLQSNLQGHYYAGMKVHFARWDCWSHNDEGEFVFYRPIGMFPFLIRFSKSVIFPKLTNDFI